MNEPGLFEDKMIYIVDDDPDVRSSISFLLETKGKANVTFASGGEFLEKVEGLEPGYIMLDVRMPDMDGSEVLRELKRRHIRWPVIIMTGHGDLDLAIDLMKLGAIDYLDKPFEASALLETLELAAKA